jgi:hypothetical protein
MNPVLTALVLAAGGSLFAWNLRRRLRALRALRPVERTDRWRERLAALLRFGFGQRRLVDREELVSLGFNINGERDIVDYNTHVAPKVFIPNHVTAVAVESSSLEWKFGYLAQQNAMGIPAEQRPELMWLVDPNDYLRPIVFDPSADRWRK